MYFAATGLCIRIQTGQFTVNTNMTKHAASGGSFRCGR